MKHLKKEKMNHIVWMLISGTPTMRYTIAVTVSTQERSRTTLTLTPTGSKIDVQSKMTSRTQRNHKNGVYR